jgi:hypothetical protein
MVTSLDFRSLDVYDCHQHLSHSDDATPREVLHWLQRLDGECVRELLVTNSHGWLDISVFYDKVSICFCNYSRQVCQTEIVTRQAAAEWILFFMGSVGRPSGLSRLT